jgi:hypothetical protein
VLLQSNECCGRAERSKVDPLHPVDDPTRLSNELVDA